MKKIFILVFIFIFILFSGFVNAQFTETWSAVNYYQYSWSFDAEFLDTNCCYNKKVGDSTDSSCGVDVGRDCNSCAEPHFCGSISTHDDYKNGGNPYFVDGTNCLYRDKIDSDAGVECCFSELHDVENSGNIGGNDIFLYAYDTDDKKVAKSAHLVPLKSEGGWADCNGDSDCGAEHRCVGETYKHRPDWTDINDGLGGSNKGMCYLCKCKPFDIITDCTNVKYDVAYEPTHADVCQDNGQCVVSSDQCNNYQMHKDVCIGLDGSELTMEGETSSRLKETWNSSGSCSEEVFHCYEEKGNGYYCEMVSWSRDTNVKVGQCTEDNSVPSVSISPDGTGWRNTNSIGFTVSGSDPDSDVWKVYYKKVPPETSSCSGVTGYNQVVGDSISGSVTCSDGEVCRKRVCYFSKNYANQESAKRLSNIFKIDRKDPDVNAQNQESTDLRPTIQFTASDQGSGLGSCSASGGGVGWDCDFDSCTAQSDLSYGTYSITINCDDNVGNSGSSSMDLSIIECTGITDCGACEECVSGMCEPVSSNNGNNCNDDCTYCDSGACVNRDQCDGTECSGIQRCGSSGGDCTNPDFDTSSGETVCEVCHGFNSNFEEAWSFESGSPTPHCCGDDSYETHRQYLTNFDGSGGDDVTDEDRIGGGTGEACCDDDDDCVDDGICFAGGTKRDIDGDGRRDGWCMTSDSYKGFWRDFDDSSNACSAIYNWVSGGETFRFGEYDTGSETECCGDDPNENYITSEYDGSMDAASDSTDACCNYNTDCVDGGSCYSHGTTSHDADGDGDSDYCQSGIWYDCNSGSQCPSPGTWSCDGVCQKQRDEYTCSNNNCVLGTGTVNVNKGMVCEGGSETDPSFSSHCDRTIDCDSGSCSANRWYRGCQSDGTGCTEDNKQPYSDWYADVNKTINEDAYRVGTSCSQSSSLECGSAGGSCIDQCTVSGSELFRCDGSGGCTNFWKYQDVNDCDPHTCSGNSCTNTCSETCGAECDSESDFSIDSGVCYSDCNTEINDNTHCNFTQETDCENNNCNADGLNKTGICYWDETCDSSGYSVNQQSCSDGTSSCSDDGVTIGDMCYWDESCDSSGYTLPNTMQCDSNKNCDVCPDSGGEMCTYDGSTWQFRGSAPAEVCDDGVDNDCDGEKDWDTFGNRGPEHGDDNCKIEIRSISVSDPNPEENTEIQLRCESNKGGVNSILADVEGNYCDFSGSWDGNYAIFDCNVGVFQSSSKTVRCSVNTSKSYQFGDDKTTEISLTPSDCSLYSNEVNCDSDNDCEWCEECSQNNDGFSFDNQFSVFGSTQCVNLGNCDYSCSLGNCNAECDDNNPCEDTCSGNNLIENRNCSNNCVCINGNETDCEMATDSDGGLEYTIAGTCQYDGSCVENGGSYCDYTKSKRDYCIDNTLLNETYNASTVCSNSVVNCNNQYVEGGYCADSRCYSSNNDANDPSVGIAVGSDDYPASVSDKCNANCGQGGVDRDGEIYILLNRSDEESGIDYCDISYDNGVTWINENRLKFTRNLSDGYYNIFYRCFDNNNNNNTDNDIVNISKSSVINGIDVSIIFSNTEPDLGEEIYAFVKGEKFESGVSTGFVEPSNTNLIVSIDGSVSGNHWDTSEYKMDQGIGDLSDVWNPTENRWEFPINTSIFHSELTINMSLKSDPNFKGGGSSEYFVNMPPNITNVRSGSPVSTDDNFDIRAEIFDNGAIYSSIDKAWVEFEDGTICDMNPSGGDEYICSGPVGFSYGSYEFNVSANDTSGLLATEGPYQIKVSTDTETTANISLEGVEYLEEKTEEVEVTNGIVNYTRGQNINFWVEVTETVIDGVLERDQECENCLDKSRFSVSVSDVKGDMNWNLLSSGEAKYKATIDSATLDCDKTYQLYINATSFEASETDEITDDFAINCVPKIYLSPDDLKFSLGDDPKTNLINVSVISPFDGPRIYNFEEVGFSGVSFMGLSLTDSITISGPNTSSTLITSSGKASRAGNYEIEVKLKESAGVRTYDTDNTEINVFAESLDEFDLEYLAGLIIGALGLMLLLL